VIKKVLLLYVAVLKKLLEDINEVNKKRRSEIVLLLCGG
jgi:hypothetical protein